MEKRRLGKTDMDVSVLGFGGSEIGYEHATPETVAELLNSALDAGLNVIDTAECYYNSEELVGQTARERGHTRYIGYSGDSRAAHFAVECGGFDTLQTSISIADQEAIDLTVPLAREKQMGVIAKRPIANAAWKTGHRPIDSYHHEYW